MSNAPNIPQETGIRIITVAKEQEVYEGVVPTDSAAILADAQELWDLSTQAWAQNIRSDAVVAILTAAECELGETNDISYPSWAQSDEAPPEAASAEETASKPPLDTSGVDVDIDIIIPGYDDLKVSDIKKAVPQMAAEGKLTPDQWALIKAYESDNEERKSILSLVVNFPEPKVAPATSPASQPAGEVGDYGDSKALEAAYFNGTLGTDRLRQEGLAVPPQVANQDDPVMPTNVEALPEAELAQLWTAFHALDVRTLYVLSEEEGRADAAGILERDAWGAAFNKAYEDGKAEVDKVTASAMDSIRSNAKIKADQDITVVGWRNRSARHHGEARSLKALHEGYEKAVARLSREQTRRQQMAAQGRAPQG